MPSFGKLLDKFDIEKEILETNERVYAQIGAIQDSVSKGQEKANEAFDLFNRRSESSDLDLNERMNFLNSMQENITRLKKHMDSIDQMKEDLKKVIDYKRSLHEVKCEIIWLLLVALFGNIALMIGWPQWFSEFAQFAKILTLYGVLKVSQKFLELKALRNWRRNLLWVNFVIHSLEFVFWVLGLIFWIYTWTGSYWNLFCFLMNANWARVELLSTRSRHSEMKKPKPKIQIVEELAIAA